MVVRAMLAPLRRGGTHAQLLTAATATEQSGTAKTTSDVLSLIAGGGEEWNFAFQFQATGSHLLPWSKHVSASIVDKAGRERGSPRRPSPWPCIYYARRTSSTPMP
jgi:hypothetical protein